MTGDSLANKKAGFVRGGLTGNSLANKKASFVRGGLTGGDCASAGGMGEAARSFCAVENALSAIWPA